MQGINNLFSIILRTYATLASVPALVKGKLAVLAVSGQPLDLVVGTASGNKLLSSSRWTPRELPATFTVAGWEADGSNFKQSFADTSTMATTRCAPGFDLASVKILMDEAIAWQMDTEAGKVTMRVSAKPSASITAVLDLLDPPEVMQ